MKAPLVGLSCLASNIWIGSLLFEKMDTFWKVVSYKYKFVFRIAYIVAEIWFSVDNFTKKVLKLEWWSTR